MPATPDTRDRFPIELCGYIVDCLTLEDAVAIRMSDAILSGADSTPYDSLRLERLTTVLVRYGHRGIAEQLAIYLGHKTG
jgi:hypothetical protein